MACANRFVQTVRACKRTLREAAGPEAVSCCTHARTGTRTHDDVDARGKVPTTVRRIGPLLTTELLSHSRPNPTRALAETLYTKLEHF